MEKKNLLSIQVRRHDISIESPSLPYAFAPSTPSPFPTPSFSPPNFSPILRRYLSTNPSPTFPSPGQCASGPSPNNCRSRRCTGVILVGAPGISFFSPRELKTQVLSRRSGRRQWYICWLFCSRQCQCARKGRRQWVVMSVMLWGVGFSDVLLGGVCCAGVCAGYHRH